MTTSVPIASSAILAASLCGGLCRFDNRRLADSARAACASISLPCPDTSGNAGDSPQGS